MLYPAVPRNAPNGENPRPLISVITACYNAEDSLVETMESVRLVKDAALEYIVVDGYSYDGTGNIIAAYAGIIDKLIREPDSGIYDALNKGINIARGDWVMVLHAGTVLSKSGALFLKERIKCAGPETLLAFSAELVDGDTRRVYLRSERKPLSTAQPSVLHESVVVPLRLYRTLGGYSPTFYVCADFAWISAALRQGVKVAYEDEILIRYMGPMGFSMRPWNQVRKIIEQFRVIRIAKGLVWASSHLVYNIVKMGFRYLRAEN